jgi:hypothetical protein
MRKQHPLCAPFADTIRVIGVFRLDDKINRWYRHAPNDNQPGRAFVKVFEKPTVSKRGEVTWPQDPDATVYIADCDCPHSACPLALALDFATNEYGCASVSVQRVPATRQPARKRRR